jgi:hypothetical protein
VTSPPDSDPSPSDTGQIRGEDPLTCTHAAHVLRDAALGEVVGLAGIQLAGLVELTCVLSQQRKEMKVEAIESQVLETASEGPTPGLGVSRGESPTHMHLLPQVLQLLRPKAERHQVAEPIIPAPREHHSRTTWHGSPDLALT